MPHRVIRAGDQFTRVADHQFAEGFFPKAAALYKKALKVKAERDRLMAGASNPQPAPEVAEA